MKYYSEKLKKVFDTPEELEKAEAAVDETKEVLISKIKEEKNNYEMAAERAKELRTEANAMIDEAREKYFKAISKYNEQYGPYITNGTDEGKSITDLFNSVFRTFF